MMSRVSSQSQSKNTSDEPRRPLTAQELHARQRELVRQSLSACPTVKKTPTHRRWA